ncbi:glutathione S-transferase family protein [Pseudoroseomonas cervicalis]|uniref:Glutathione S-transferase, N-terminal domain protein n=1 Tax=Pseudoroseomonas cervicalis ATCC 49957 TaxID=525371 RepID=D5RSK1_9PROT|nr:glutathione S-transferase N-terminal domain-containing protein [Pseudoroseomonas cervicalis]EFH09716.1 glutathione S-transferase, N-terminal domain protein [Pseudoroseomonas cervicalis ATCC 49957]
MKLYYSPGACSLGIHVVLEEIGQPFEAVRSPIKEGALQTPEFQALNPKGKVPTLVRDDGSVLTQYTAIAFWLAASNPGAGLLPADAEGQARALEMVDFVTGTIHPQGFSRLFNQARFAPSEADHAAVKQQGWDLAAKGFATVEKQWQGGEWVLPSGYSIADSALFVVEYWAVKRMNMDLPPKVQAHFERMLARPAVQRAMASEGLA